MIQKICMREKPMIQKICMFVAWHLLPNQLVYWCAIRVAAHATTNEYSSQNVTELTAWSRSNAGRLRSRRQPRN